MTNLSQINKEILETLETLKAQYQQLSINALDIGFKTVRTAEQLSESKRVNKTVFNTWSACRMLDRLKEIATDLTAEGMTQLDDSNSLYKTK